jgi:hypothetical protein
MQETKKPIGDFIINNSKGTQTENGVYYHYTEVCRLLKLYEKQLLIHSVVVPKGTFCNFYKKECIKEFCGVTPHWQKCKHLE